MIAYSRRSAVVATALLLNVLVSAPPRAAVAAPAARLAGPTSTDIKSAIEANFHEYAGFEGAWCDRIEDVNCKRSRRDPAQFRCTFREAIEEDEEESPRPPRKTAVLRRVGDGWLWVHGDSPHCSVSVVE